MPKNTKQNPIWIDRRSAVALHQQVYDRIRIAITEGRLAPGERLPSTRNLAVQLSIARGTVDGAYARLATEGYIVGRNQNGTIVSPALQTDMQSGAKSRPKAGKPAELSLPMQLGVPVRRRPADEFHQYSGEGSFRHCPHIAPRVGLTIRITRVIVETAKWADTRRMKRHRADRKRMPF